MSYSVPTSPAVSRSSKIPPVTPQRPPHRHQPRSQSFHRSPLSPPSPYTPISLRSFESNSSTLTTPDNSGFGIRKRPAFAGLSPDVARSSNSSRDRSLADIAENWRTRANENGIKVSFASQDNAEYVLEESSDMSLPEVGNDSNILSNDEDGLATAYLTGHRRLSSLPTFTRPRAQSYAPLPPRAQPQSPMALGSSRGSSSQRQSMHNQNVTASLMATPPPNRSLAKQLKLKGCQTDPPQPRRREALSLVSLPPNLKNASMSMNLGPDTSLDLFDIHENDLEYESDYELSDPEASFANRVSTQDIEPFAYPTFGSLGVPSQTFPYVPPPFADPFHSVGNVNHLQGSCNFAESVEHHFHTSRQQIQGPYFEDLQPVPAFLNPPAHYPASQYSQAMPQPYRGHGYTPHSHMHAIPLPSTPAPRPPFERSFSNTSSSFIPQRASFSVPPTDCSVCLAVKAPKLAILQPCGHPLCSACLTSALNIVGEKDMQCAVCKQGVADFKLIMPARDGHETPTSDVGAQGSTSNSLIEPLFASSSSRLSGGPTLPHDVCGDLDSAFEFGLDFGDLRASTPKLEQQLDHSMSQEKRGEGENVVLRIDNVPWDITPSQIVNWLQQPVERVHVLLDRKGKTMSHAYVEVRSAGTAGSILRGEAASTNGRKERGSVLGKGRRARGVTVTRSGQQELMADLFPHWPGNFDGAKPTLVGLDSERLVVALEGGLLHEHEISSLLQLIREPDSHFLKVPSLPFHSLISWLCKFPTDLDSRVFWSASVRDRLFDATFTALETLISRVEEAMRSQSKASLSAEYTNELVIELLYSALHFRGFSDQQLQHLTNLAERHRLPLPAIPTPSISGTRLSDGTSAPMTPISLNQPTTIPDIAGGAQRSGGSLDDLAREFGVDAHLVEALAQRLARLS